MSNIDLFGEVEIDHDQEIDYMEHYESTSNEFTRTGHSPSDLDKLNDIKLKRAPSNANIPELNVTDDNAIEELHECRNWTAGDDDHVSHFPHRIEIGLQFALNMVTLASWLIVIIVYAKQGDRHETRQKVITGIILAASSVYLIASLFAVTSAQIGLLSYPHRYTVYDEQCLAYLFGGGFGTMKNVCGWMKIIAFYTCQWSQCLLFCYIVKQKTWRKDSEVLRVELESVTLANAALAPAKRRFLIVGGGVTAVAIIISIVLNVKTDWFYTDNGDMFTVTKDLGLFRSFRLPESTGHSPFIMLSLPIPILALVLFIVMMANVYKTRQMRLRHLNRDGSDRSDKSAGGESEFNFTSAVHLKPSARSGTPKSRAQSRPLAPNEYALPLKHRLHHHHHIQVCPSRVAACLGGEFRSILLHRRPIWTHSAGDTTDTGQT